MSKENIEPGIRYSSLQIFMKFIRFGCLAWGGPVAQIAMIKKELVDDEKWISRDQFNRALAVYQVLPGPEAHELCVYFGMKAKGRWGGFLAGFGFMLPGLLLMLLLTWFYVRYGIRSSLVQAIFASIQVAVVSLIAFAVYRISKHAITNKRLVGIAIVSGLSFFAGVHFLLILLIAGLCYTFWNKGIIVPILSFLVIASVGTFSISQKGLKLETVSGEKRSVVNQANDSKANVFVTGLKGGLLSFGGAYTAIPIIQQDAVVNRRWMSQEQFLDGIAISGILPAPLIIFATFAGYFGGGWLGALIITTGIFLPAFSFTLVGHSVMERLISNKELHNFLDGVTAGVIGLIAGTAIKLFIATITGIPSLILFLCAVLILVKFKSKFAAMVIIAGAGLVGLLSNLLT